MPATHEIINQTPPLADYNLYRHNLPLREAVAREGAGWAEAELAARGAEIGSAAMMAAASDANRNPPLLRRFDANGERRDEVEFHPAYHQLLAYLKRHGAASGPWREPKPGAHVARAALFLMFAEIEGGALCPTTMTYAAVPVMRRESGLLGDWLPGILASEYDPRFLPPRQKLGLTMGMGLTEKQGGSDVRANSTVARRQSGGEYRIRGHKWFLSAPMSDAFLITAQTETGLSCFFLPRHTPDGKVNDLRLERLKDKLGDRSNASAEAEFENAAAWLVGEEGRGLPTILEMGNYTRLDCALGSAGLMRQALSQALHHASHRAAFGRLLARQPLMRNVLADMALEAEAATALCLRLARAYDGEEEEAVLLRRLLTPAVKYWICKRTPSLVAEAMEALGGNGYVEEGAMARLFRQSPLNSIWEGSGNVMCLDVLRAVRRAPRALEALAAELAPALGRNQAFDRHVAKVKDAALAADEACARQLAAGIAVALQAALLLRYAPEPVADAFCAARLPASGGAFGALAKNADFAAILGRAWPGLD